MQEVFEEARKVIIGEPCTSQDPDEAYHLAIKWRTSASLRLPTTNIDCLLGNFDELLDTIEEDSESAPHRAPVYESSDLRNGIASTLNTQYSGKARAIVYQGPRDMARR